MPTAPHDAGTPPPGHLLAPPLRIVPLKLAHANALVARLHRHHHPVVAHRFSLGAMANGELIGAAICDRPASPRRDQHQILEVSRLATDGTPNACSCLLGACARAARAMGFARIQTFTLAHEPGTSLRAAGWTPEDTPHSGQWTTRPGRRTDQLGPKVRWALELTAPEPGLDDALARLDRQSHPPPGTPDLFAAADTHQPKPA